MRARVPIHRLLTIGLVLLASFLSQELSAQTFSCSFGRAACLDYGDTVCSSAGKCVDSNAVCFDEYQCGFGGFTCKSNLDDCATDYNDLLRKHNDLVNDYNNLLDVANQLENDLQDAVENARNLSACVFSAGTLSEAQDCAY